ncbi:MAG: NIPSNAP family protein [Myxococcota bacterium]|nr:NIPSNAP family protein [Myxococcota bacterium]
MVTCTLRYVIDPSKTEEFEQYARLWMPLVERFGGTHHGYFLPSEGASDVALALFSFPSLARYEEYRERAREDPDCQAAIRFGREAGCVVRFERSFFRPVFSEPRGSASGADEV